MVLLFGLEFPARVALLDCRNRPECHFPGGAQDRRAWLAWLCAGMAGAWMMWGNGIVLGYYHANVKRSFPAQL